ncbi:MAG: aminoacyl-tRNA hydrolase [Ectothiorhodospiraceae bacterium]|nr:aminoacyl-tRNA hydrolase [Ectothiorhodospiraceae bacterium]
MVRINRQITIPDDELEISAIRAQGAGGQHVNKAATAVHLRFDIAASSLPRDIKQRLRALPDQRISADGVVVIKAQKSRSQARNREDAVARLRALIQTATRRAPARIPTRPGQAARRRRVESKVKRGRIKAMRGRTPPGE